MTIGIKGFQKGNHPKTEFKEGNKIGPRFKKGHKVIGGFHKGNKVNLGRTGDKSGHWKGGRATTTQGYVYIYNPNHPFATQDGYVYEHRLVVEKQIGRYLHRWEAVHHQNEFKTDNQPKNLMAFANESVHQRFHKDPNSVKPEEIIFDGRNT